MYLFGVNNLNILINFLSFAFLAVNHLMLECLFEFVNTKKLNL